MWLNSARVRRTPGISCERPVCSTLVSFIPLFGSLVALPQELLSREANVLRYLAQQRGRDVAAREERNRSPTAVYMPELLVGTFCRTSPNPRPSRRATTSRGLSVGSLPTTQP
jgi:hypothetical protein